MQLYILKWGVTILLACSMHLHVVGQLMPSSGHGIIMLVSRPTLVSLASDKVLIWEWYYGALH